MLTVSDARHILTHDCGPRLTLMEVCGTHTHTIAASGLRSLLAPSIRLVSGPGCPVCVTPAGYIDSLCGLARRADHLVACFGDMIRVPGHAESLGQAAAAGGQVRMIYSPLDALDLCRQDPERTVIVAAVGFETTAPSYGLLLERARQAGIQNLQLLTALRRMPPALERLCGPEASIDGFLAPGHVSAILGSDAYQTLAMRSGKPFVIAGFTPEQVLIGLAELVRICRARQSGPRADGESLVVNCYPAVVRPEGNLKAQAVLDTVFRMAPAHWRGLGLIDQSGYYLATSYAAYDADPDHLLCPEADEEPSGCQCGDILLGLIGPEECPLFGRVCRPESPVGPCMVSSEGVCGIHFRFPSERSPESC